jgi:Flp pilus assembly protein TadD
MRKQVTAAAVVVMLVAGTAALRSQAAKPAAPPRAAAAATPSLAGTWRSAAEQMKLTSDFEKSVWGPDASSVRTVELVVRAAGDATLTITKKVVDGKGRTVPASTWVEEAQLQIGAGQDGIATRVDHDTKVTKAVRLFPDDPQYRWNLDGLRVRVVTFKDGDGNTIEIRYDTPEGRGSFWETLRRDRAAPSRRTSG